MRILIEEIDGFDYCDIILSEKEVYSMKFGEMVTGKTYFHGKEMYIGIYEIKDLIYEKEIAERKRQDPEDNE